MADGDGDMRAEIERIPDPEQEQPFLVRLQLAMNGPGGRQSFAAALPPDVSLAIAFEIIRSNGLDGLSVSTGAEIHAQSADFDFIALQTTGGDKLLGLNVTKREAGSHAGTLQVTLTRGQAATLVRQLHASIEQVWPDPLDRG